MKKVYLASGWFTHNQVQYLDILEYEMINQSKYDFFAPRLHNLGEEGKTDWDLIYQRNIDELSFCDYMIAITTDKDMGTLVEVGQFLQMKKPVIFFTPGLIGNFNLMLAKPAHRVCTSLKELQAALNNLEIKIPYNNTIE